MKGMSRLKKYLPSRFALNFIRLAMVAVSAALTFIAYRYLYSYQILMYVLIGLFWGLSFLFGFILFPIYFAKTSYSVSSDIVSKHSGFIFTTKQLMRGSSIQYITTIFLPFSSLTAFNFIIINALGGKIFLTFLSKSDAAEITACLNKAIEKRKN